MSNRSVLSVKQLEKLREIEQTLQSEFKALKKQFDSFDKSSLIRIQKEYDEVLTFQSKTPVEIAFRNQLIREFDSEYYETYQPLNSAANSWKSSLESRLGDRLGNEYFYEKIREIVSECGFNTMLRRNITEEEKYRYTR